MKINNPYRILGIVIAIAGAVLAPVFYFIVGSPALTAACISAIILGVTCIAIANARPYLSPEAARILLNTGMENTAALLEELGLNEKAIYTPSSVNNRHARALIPLSRSTGMPFVKDKLSGRLIVRYGAGLEDMAIAVTTPGSVALELLEHKPLPAVGEIETSLNYLLLGVLDIARGVRVDIADSYVMVNVNEPKLSFENIWYYQCLGSPIASITATVISEAMNKPVRIVEETEKNKQSVIKLEILR